MKVYDIKPYEQKKPVFGAKVHLAGNVDTLPRNVVLTIKANAKRIGKRNDLIMFYFGKREINLIPCVDGDIMHQYRYVFAKSKINDLVRDEDLSYNVFNDRLEESSIIFEAICEYLGNLRRSIRTTYGKQ